LKGAQEEIVNFVSGEKHTGFLLKTNTTETVSHNKINLFSLEDCVQFRWSQGGGQDLLPQSGSQLSVAVVKSTYCQSSM
jgi:hypothetical protein